MNIIAGTAQTDGSLAYRVMLPLLCLQRLGHNVSLLHVGTKDTAIHTGVFYGRDFLLLQKVSNPKWFDMVASLPEEVRPITLYDIDDLVWCMPKSNPSYKDWSKMRDGVFECIRLADVVICSTATLRDAVKKLSPGKRTRIAPNFIDFGIREWDLIEPKPEGVNIGWFGGMHHKDDEKGHFAEGIKRVLFRNPHVNFLFAGSADLYKDWSRSIGNTEQVRYIGSRPFNKCQSLISQFDIGVAPLATSWFNSCKSDLKLCEYGAYGIPYVANNIEPYREYHAKTGGNCGYLASSAGDWSDQLELLVNSVTMRTAMGAANSEYVHEHRGPTACGEHWIVMLEGILEQYGKPGTKIIRA
jgi:glycosyltransferase involved in cell wall biosynthesis